MQRFPPLLYCLQRVGYFWPPSAPLGSSLTCIMSIAMAWVCTPSTLFTNQCTTSALMKQDGERPFCSESSWIPVLKHSKSNVLAQPVQQFCLIPKTKKHCWVGKKKKKEIKIEVSRCTMSPKWNFVSFGWCDREMTLTALQHYSHWEFSLWQDSNSSNWSLYCSAGTSVSEIHCWRDWNWKAKKLEKLFPHLTGALLWLHIHLQNF